MKKKSIKLKKYGSIENKAEKHNIWCTGKVMGTSMTNEDCAYQVQCMLADELDAYSGWGNQYMDDNIKEIQELYKDREQTKDTNQG